MPPPENCLADALVRLIVPVPVMDKFEPETVQEDTDPEIIHVAEPIDTALTLVPELVNPAPAAVSDKL
jgi:hypothetical protein